MAIPGRTRRMLRRADAWLAGPDFGRAVRASAGLMAPLLLARAGWLPVQVSFAAIAAQSMGLVDVRGAYPLRFALLLAMALVLAGSAGLGALAAGSVVAAVAATALMAAAAGLWRHLSVEYGPSLATPAALVFLMALAAPPTASQGSHAGHGLSVLAGALLGVALQVALWPVSAQHPLRRAAADSWLAVADLFVALSPAPPGGKAVAPERVAARESQLRTTLDATYAVLHAAGAARRAFPASLEQLHVAAARLATRVSALHTTLEAMAGRPMAVAIAPSLAATLEALANAARSVAVAVVSRQPASLLLCDVRLRRAGSLLRGLAVRAGTGPDSAALVGVLHGIEAQLPAVAGALAAVTGRAGERAEFSLQLFDLNDRMLRPLAASLNLSPRVEPAIARYAARIGVLMMLGVLAFNASGLPHGYWLPFTAVVVLQPDYGATRRKALQRVGGTLAGGALASALLLLHLPAGAALAATAATAFLFAYFLRRRYGVAVVFITLFVVLLTESSGPASLSLAAERMGLTSAGGAMALLATLLFWPAWERDRLRPILAAALRANRDYLLALSASLARGGTYGHDVSLAKRRVETANNEAFASLQRLYADPASRREGAEQAAVLANGNQRLTRALNVILSQQTPASPPVEHAALGRFVDLAAAALAHLAAEVEGALDPKGPTDPGPPAVSAGQIQLPLQDLMPAASGLDRSEAGLHDWMVFGQLARAGAELRAMLLAPRPAAWVPAPAARTAAEDHSADGEPFRNV